MEMSEAVKLMLIEKECVLRQDTDKCNRDECGCQCCDLIQETTDVLEAYDCAVDAMKFTQKMCEIMADVIVKQGFDNLDDFVKYIKEV